MARDKRAAMVTEQEYVCSYLVLEAGHAEVEQVQQPVDLQHREVRHPSLQQAGVGVLQHPQEAHQQGAAALRRQTAGLAARLRCETHLLATPLHGIRALFTCLATALHRFIRVQTQNLSNRSLRHHPATKA